MPTHSIDDLLTTQIKSEIFSPVMSMFWPHDSMWLLYPSMQCNHVYLTCLLQRFWWSISLKRANHLSILYNIVIIPIHCSQFDRFSVRADTSRNVDLLFFNSVSLFLIIYILQQWRKRTISEISEETIIIGSLLSAHVSRLLLVIELHLIFTSTSNWVKRRGTHLSNLVWLDHSICEYIWIFRQI